MSTSFESIFLWIVYPTYRVIFTSYIHTRIMAWIRTCVHKFVLFDVINHLRSNFDGNITPFHVGAIMYPRLYLNDDIADHLPPSHLCAAAMVTARRPISTTALMMIVVNSARVREWWSELRRTIIYSKWRSNFSTIQSALGGHCFILQAEDAMYESMWHRKVNSYILVIRWFTFIRYILLSFQKVVFNFKSFQIM